MHMESMEQRSLLSAALASGVLTVTGTDKNDAITVYTKGTEIIVSEFVLPDPPADGTVPTTKPTPITPTVTKFTLTDVTSIVVNAGAGNDSIMLGKRPKGQVSLGATLNGGAGNDRIAGGLGNDTISGGAGKDRLFGNEGNDLLNGDANNDKLDGGKGVDTLNAGTGNDFLFSVDDSADVLNGGANDAVTEDTDGDVAVIDKLDVSVTDVEKSTTRTAPVAPTKPTKPTPPTTPTTPTTPGDTTTPPTLPGGGGDDRGGPGGHGGRHGRHDGPPSLPTDDTTTTT